MKEIFILILVALVSSFSKSVFDRILKEYKPDKKKLISIVKKYLLFAIRYILPIVYLIYLFIYGEFNKSFVFMNAFMISVFFTNILVDALTNIQNKTNALIRTMTNIQKQVIDKLSSDEISEAIENKTSP